MRRLLCSAHTNSIITSRSITQVVWHSIRMRENTRLTVHYQTPRALEMCTQSKGRSNLSHCSTAFIIDFKTLLNPQSLPGTQPCSCISPLSPSPLLSPEPTNQVKALHSVLLRVQWSQLPGVAWLCIQQMIWRPTKQKESEKICPPLAKMWARFSTAHSGGTLMKQKKNDPGIAYLFGLATQRQSNWRLLIAKCNLTVTFNYPFSVSQISRGKCNPVLLIRSPTEIKLPFL